MRPHVLTFSRTNISSQEVFSEEGGWCPRESSETSSFCPWWGGTYRCGSSCLVQVRAGFPSVYEVPVLGWFFGVPGLTCKDWEMRGKVLPLVQPLSHFQLSLIEGAHLRGQEGLLLTKENVALGQAAHSHANCLSERWRVPSAIAAHCCSSTVRDWLLAFLYNLFVR